jgi:hypothetical protein
MSFGSILATWCAASIVVGPVIGTLLSRCNPEVAPVRIDVDRIAAPAGSNR